MSLTTEIVKALHSASGQAVSGEVLAEQLGVSRMAISKAVSKLNANGYQIDSRPRVGYALTALPQTINAEAVSALVDSKFWKHVAVFEQVGSTNDEARKALGEGVATPAVFVAREQTQGRGRLGRRWTSSLGGLYVSILVTDRVDIAQASSLSLVAGLCVAEVLGEQGIEAHVKWPNDVIVEGHKIAGILIEMTSDVDGVNSLVIGIGLNVNRPNSAESPNGANEQALDSHAKPAYISDRIGQIASESGLCASLLDSFQNKYSQWLAQGFAPFVEQFSDVQAQRGEEVTVSNPLGDVVANGIVRGVDESGKLLLETAPTEIVSISSGEVTLRRNV